MSRDTRRAGRDATGFLLPFGLLGWAAVWPSAASAHVKWFAPFDLTVEPTPAALFISQNAWLLGLALSIPALWLAVGMDELARRREIFSDKNGSMAATPAHADDIVRVSMGVWLTWLWALPAPVFLTPELTAPTPHVQWLQLAVSAFCISRRTTWITGLGLVVLYAAASSHYGLFHVADYPLFLGVAAYLIGVSAAHSRSSALRRLAAHRYSVLVIAMATTLCWASIEKWGYPSWSMPILEERAYLSLGLDPGQFMALAGWVEFGLAILLVIGGRVSSRLAALTLFVMFTAAVLEFGKMDLVGHLPIIASLTLVVARGNGDVGMVAGLSRRPMRVRLAWLPLGYFASLLVTAAAYLGGWHLAYGELALLDWNGRFDPSFMIAAPVVVATILAIAIVALVYGPRPHQRTPVRRAALANRLSSPLPRRRYWNENHY